MDSQLLLYINIFLGLVLIGTVSYLFKKQKPPTRLNIKAGEKYKKFEEYPGAKLKYEQRLGDFSSKMQKLNEKPPAQEWLDPEAKPSKLSLPPLPLVDKSKAAKNLSIYFMFNGHDWEAHEVLGIPQGANLQLATLAYQKLVKSEDPSTFEFYESAFNAILQRRKNERL